MPESTGTSLAPPQSVPCWSRPHQDGNRDVVRWGPLRAHPIWPSKWAAHERVSSIRWSGSVSECRHIVECCRLNPELREGQQPDGASCLIIGDR